MSLRKYYRIHGKLPDYIIDGLWSGKLKMKDKKTGEVIPKEKIFIKTDDEIRESIDDLVWEYVNQTDGGDYKDLVESLYNLFIKNR